MPTSRTGHTADVLCHCPTDPEGHPLSTPGCTARVTAGTYPTRSSHYDPNRPTSAGEAASIFAELARTTADPVMRDRYRSSVRILTAADREAQAQAQAKLTTPLHRIDAAEQALRTGTPGEKRRAKVSLAKARDLLTRASAQALALRRRNLW